MRMRKTIKSLRSNLKRLLAKSSGLTFEKNSELRTPNSELLVKNKGFTLIEIIILIVMAGILLPVIIVPFATGIKGSQKPEMVTTAMFLAHQKMEELMKFDYCRTPELTPGTYNLPAPPITGYTWTWTISYVNDTFAVSGSDVGYKMITVTVTDPQTSTYNVSSVVTKFQ
ncbi:MAG: type II secretion system protein [Deltaproteobacteria bacterium]|nr:type II secretion system protein [Deltaproteobacteria bacterium]